MRTSKAQLSDVRLEQHAKREAIARAEKAEARVAELEATLVEIRKVTADDYLDPLGRIESLAAPSASKTLGTAVPEREPEIPAQTGAPVPGVQEGSGRTEARPNKAASPCPSPAGVTESLSGLPGRPGEGARQCPSDAKCVFPGCAERALPGHMHCGSTHGAPTDHVWRFVASHGQDAQGQSLDTYEQCERCGALRHDYRHNGGQRSPNYPEIRKYGRRISIDDPCLGLLGAARSDASESGERTNEAKADGLTAARVLLRRAFDQEDAFEMLRLVNLAREQIAPSMHACTDYPRPDLAEARSSLEYLRATASGNDYANEHELRKHYERVDDALDALEARPETTLPDEARRAANELIDAISNPKGRDFDPAWEEACLFFGRSGALPTRFTKLAVLAEATRLYVHDDDEDRVATWDRMVNALDDALDALPPSLTGSEEP